MTGSSRTAGNRNGSEWLTVEEVCAELKISPRTFYRWRAQGTGPRSKRMAKGGLRVRRSWLDEWLDEGHQLDSPRLAPGRLAHGPGRGL